MMSAIGIDLGVCWLAERQLGACGNGSIGAIDGPACLVWAVINRSKITSNCSINIDVTYFSRHSQSWQKKALLYWSQDPCGHRGRQNDRKYYNIDFCLLETDRRWQRSLYVFRQNKFDFSFSGSVLFMLINVFIAMQDR